MKDHARHAGRAGRLVIALAALAAAAGVLLWGWNTLAVELLSQPAMRFRHAVALELIVLALAAAPLIARRLVAAYTPACRHRRRQTP